MRTAQLMLSRVEDNPILFSFWVLYIRTQVGKKLLLSLLLLAVSSLNVWEVVLQPPTPWQVKGCSPPCSVKTQSNRHKALTYGNPMSIYRELVPEKWVLQWLCSPRSYLIVTLIGGGALAPCDADAQPPCLPHDSQCQLEAEWTQVTGQRRRRRCQKHLEEQEMTTSENKHKSIDFICMHLLMYLCKLWCRCLKGTKVAIRINKPVFPV